MGILKINKSFWKRFLLGIAALALAIVIWLPVLNLLYRGGTNGYFSEKGVSPKAAKLLARNLRIWNDPVLKTKEVAVQHESNPEWDFMWRTFFVLSMASASLEEPQRQAQLLPVMDAVIDETISLIDKNGIHYFLMKYARLNQFIVQPPRSLFHDGEIALMIGARRLVQDNNKYRVLNRKYINIITERMGKGPLYSAESYPNECWIFCNTVSLAAIKIYDVLDGTDHSAFTRKWIATAKQQLVDPRSGLLISAYMLSGDRVQGPEGSTIWMAIHCLDFVDEDFARAQYEQTKKELTGNYFGFGFSSEWPISEIGYPDCDAGGLFAFSRVSPSASVFALLAAHTFNDKKLMSQIVASLRLGALPREDKNTLKFDASNLVGDAVAMYALVEGPLRLKVKSADDNRVINKRDYSSH